MQDNTQEDRPEVQENTSQTQEQMTAQGQENSEVSQPTQIQTPGDVGGEEHTTTIMSEQTGDGERKKSKKWLVLLLVAAVVGIGAIVGGYLVGKKAKLARQQQREERVISTPTPEEKDSLTEVYENLSSSDEVPDIENDLSATTFKGLDKELSEIDNEFASQE